MTAFQASPVLLKENGQLVRIHVRPSEKYPGKYDLIYGHRRFLAAKKLSWKTIKAEIEDATEEEMAIQSLVENVQREDLSDYEKTLFFQKLSTEFKMTYQQIGKTCRCIKTIHSELRFNDETFYK
jgi:ParB family chromosome partitioning protein